MSDSIIDKLPRQAPTCFYEASKKHYWMPDKNGHFVPLNREDMSVHLALAGWGKKKNGATGLSETDQFLADVQLNHRVDYAGQLAGHRPGYLIYDTLRILVTDAPELIRPVSGRWDTIRTIAERLVGPEQLPFLLGWHQQALMSLHTAEKKPGQMLALAGPAGCGKSFWQNRVITPMLGNRVARPMQFMTGGTSFNEDVIRAEHLILEDENSSTDIKSRRNFGSAIKNFTVNRVQRLHPKGKTALNLPSWHRMSLSVNDEAENLAILPPLDESLADKMILVKCNMAIEYGSEGLAGQQELERRVSDELPAFIHYLLNDHKVPEELVDERFGIRAYLNPDLTEEIDGLAPEMALMDMVDRAYFTDSRKETRQAASEIQNTLIQHPDTEYMAKKLLNFPTATGVYLGRLERKFPNLFVRDGKNFWKLKKRELA